MANNVFANGREVACKKGSGKSICAFPDVVWTPPDKVPPTPTGVPVPYPNTAMASDTSKGTKKVKISGKEAMLKNSSNFKKSMGDEAGVAQLKGFMTMKNRGKVYFQMWSMDVKFEGKNVVRHLDIATHNHGSQVGNTPPWPFMDSMEISKDPCAKDKKTEEDSCKNYGDPCKDAGLDGAPVQKDVDAGKHLTAASWASAKAKSADANKCVKARRCKLGPYTPKNCCASQTPDHVIPKSSFYEISVKDGEKVDGWSKYNPDNAPCMCLEGASNTAGNHGLRHAYHKAFGPEKGTMESFNKQAERAAESASAVSGCDKECLVAQLKSAKGHPGDKRKKIKHSPSGSQMSRQDIQSQVAARNPTVISP